MRDGAGRIVECVDSENQEATLLIKPCLYESAFGSYYDYPVEKRPEDFDGDKDGMADDWEMRHGLDPQNSADRNDDMVGDGWTNLEYYLNQLAGDYDAR
jgi:hypothetical protein